MHDTLRRGVRSAMQRSAMQTNEQAMREARETPSCGGRGAAVVATVAGLGYISNDTGLEGEEK